MFALNAQNPNGHELKKQSLFHANYPLFFKDWHGYSKKQNMFVLSYEHRFYHKKIPNFYSSAEVGAGIIFSEIEKNRFAPMLDYSFGYNYKNHFFEVGIGTVFWHSLIHANIGYGILLNKHFMFRAIIKPASYIFKNFFQDKSQNFNYTYINFSIGYQLSPAKSKTLKIGFNSFIQRFSVQLSANPFGYKGEYDYKLVKSIGLDFLMFKQGRYQSKITFGIGRHLGRIFEQVSFSYLYGKKNHFLESNFQIIFARLQDPSFEFAYDDYRLFQPQLGYRYQFNFPVFIRIAYAPYIRTLDWKREGELHHNMVLGVGYQLRKYSN
jgi:hypothetical protein